MAGGVGAFGKMPSVGDFFRINTPKGFVKVWDAWLQHTILTARTALGADWEALYMSAPIWRFSLSAGVAGEQKRIGVLMPSIDRVGRQYPLALVLEVLTSGSASSDHFSAVPLFERLETLALDCLEDDMNRDRLIQALAEIEIPVTQGAPEMCRRGSSIFVRGVETRTPMAELASARVDQSVSCPCLFSAVVDGSERLMICDGLPKDQEAVGMFDLQSPIWSEVQVT